MAETKRLIEEEDVKAEVRLRSTLEELASSSLRYQTVSKINATGPGSGKTKLDKERMKLCLREVVGFPKESCLFPTIHSFLIIFRRKILETWLAI